CLVVAFRLIAEERELEPTLAIERAVATAIAAPHSREDRRNVIDEADGALLLGKLDADGLARAEAPHFRSDPCLTIFDRLDRSAGINRRYRRVTRRERGLAGQIPQASISILSGDDQRLSEVRAKDEWV